MTTKTHASSFTSLAGYQGGLEDMCIPIYRVTFGAAACSPSRWRRQLIISTARQNDGQSTDARRSSAHARVRAFLGGQREGFDRSLWYQFCSAFMEEKQWL